MGARGWLRDPILPLAIPAALWVAAVCSRSRLIVPRCAQIASLCVAEAVPAVDRIALRFENGFSDDISLYAEIATGILIFAIPVLLWLGRRKPGGGRGLMEDLRWVGEACLWNGLCTEVARIAVQRPRPFVYAAPLEQGLNPAHYTSFYSGHTSFVAAGACALLLCLARKPAVPKPALYSVGVLGAAMVALTAVCRVLSGRHFPTDVAAGALAGAATVLVAWRARQSRDLHSSPRKNV